MVDAGLGLGGRFLSPASSISLLGAAAGQQKAISCPRFANSLAMGTVRVGKPRSLVNSVVKRNFFISTLLSGVCWQAFGAPEGLLFGYFRWLDCLPFNATRQDSFCLRL